MVHVYGPSCDPNWLMRHKKKVTAIKNFPYFCHGAFICNQFFSFFLKSVRKSAALTLSAVSRDPQRKQKEDETAKLKAEWRSN